MIHLRNVRKQYWEQAHPALRGVTFRMKPGEFAFLVGPSGSGKSTLLRILHGEEEASSGIILVNNYDVAHLTRRQLPYYRRTVGMVYQDFRLIPNRTVEENLSFAMRAIGAPDKQIRARVEEVLEQVELTGHKHNYPTELSGGEQQRVAVARAILNHPALVLADEPTGNLDPKLSYEMMKLFEQINEDGTTVLVVTHEQSLVDRFHKRVIRLEEGKIVADEEDGLYQSCET
ncbi:MAG: cell division ATP-binding protein FtsE [Clostridiales bacterium]|nr:cell division ATP-binding protein FtsE [Clostridiales bacterium]MCC8099213.1 cell division ATP-binding protein FtsE [Clostridiales bacterium]